MVKRWCDLPRAFDAITNTRYIGTVCKKNFTPRLLRSGRWSLNGINRWLVVQITFDSIFHNGSAFDLQRRDTFDSDHRCIIGMNSSLCRDFFGFPPLADRADTLFPLIRERS